MLPRFVEQVRHHVHAMGDVTPVDLPPDGRTSLVFRVFEDRAQGDVCVMGPRTRALYKKATQTTRSAIVQLKPGWSASLLGMAANELTEASARLARQAVRLLEGGEARVDGVAERLGVTARHLRRAFTEHVGIGPKDFARTVRLQRAVRLAETSRITPSGHALGTSFDWGRIAVDSGYYDQAHLITDFRELVGLTPGAFARRATERDALASAAE